MACAAAIVLLACAPNAVAQPLSLPPGGGAGGMAATPPPVQGTWHGREFQPGVNADDEGRDIAYWEHFSDPEQKYVFVTGFVTTPDGATRFATFRYKADHAGPVQAAEKSAYYPPLAVQLQPGEVHKAVALTVDFQGNVYVTGESPNPGNGKKDVITIKYDKDLLQPSGMGSHPWPDNGDGPGIRRFDGILIPDLTYPPTHEGGHDVPTDITCMTNAGEAVAVAATCEWYQSGRDIVAIAYDQDGNAYPLWPSIGGDYAGMRRYGGSESGEDRSCEIGGPNIACEGDEGCALVVTLNGTTQDVNNNFRDDIVTLQFYKGDALGTDLGIRWSDRYDGACGLDDIATALVFPNDTVFSTVYSVGYGHECGEHPHPSDFVTIAYDIAPLIGIRLWSDKYDFGGDDYSADARSITGWNGDYEVAVTGRTNSGGLGAATVIYNHTSGATAYSQRRTHVFSPVAGRDHRALGVALRAAAVSPEVYHCGLSTALSAGNYDALVYRLASTSPILLQWWTLFFDTGNPGYDAGHAIVIDEPGSPNKPKVFFTGTSFKTGTGKDFVTVCFKQN